MMDSTIRKPINWPADRRIQDRKSTRLNSSHQIISYAVFCLKKKIKRSMSNGGLARDSRLSGTQINANRGLASSRVWRQGLTPEHYAVRSCGLRCAELYR